MLDDLGYLLICASCEGGSGLDGSGEGSDADPVFDRMTSRPSGGGAGQSGSDPFTPRSKRLLARAAEEALSLSDDHLGTEHILLAIAHEPEAVAAGVRRALGLDLAFVPRAVVGTPCAAGLRTEGRFAAAAG